MPSRQEEESSFGPDRAKAKDAKAVYFPPTSTYRKAQKPQKRHRVTHRSPESIDLEFNHDESVLFWSDRGGFRLVLSERDKTFGHS